ncbi:hypothetical protein PHJA_001017100 [Phtheirospermum japonicum]|uniref:Remorin C-terminal domain-containing protein n=1 Tax=Phtheirospermum japonicum TaxID=374723 RepID=A0A830BWP2_9LAMI|nr:hypothetical protein PHJA_001017100 [Phtheirospermum japonicum]
MSSDYDVSGVANDYPAAIAAAAYAIQSLEESKPNKGRKETIYGPGDKSLNKTKSKVEDNEPLKSALKSSVYISGETSKKSFKDPDNYNKPSASKRIPEKEPSFKKRISFADIDETIIRNKLPEKPALETKKATEVAPPSMKRPPTFADKQLNKTTKMQNEIKPGPRDSQADAWEKEEMTSINERYEKLRATIDNWETKKKRKAKRKTERTEAEIDKRRAKAMQSHRIEMTRIEGIARGARAQAEKNRRKEEFKVKEKANKIRLTGKIPATCLCF